MKGGGLPRRSFVKQSALAAVTTLPLASTPAESRAASLRIVCVGAHPDDPESGCGGTRAGYAALAPSAANDHPTRPAPRIAGTSLDEAGRARTCEIASACHIIRPKPS